MALNEFAHAQMGVPKEKQLHGNPGGVKPKASGSTPSMPVKVVSYAKPGPAQPRSRNAGVTKLKTYAQSAGL